MRKQQGDKCQEVLAADIHVAWNITVNVTETSFQEIKSNTYPQPLWKELKFHTFSTNLSLHHWAMEASDSGNSFIEYLFMWILTYKLITCNKLENINIYKSKYINDSKKTDQNSATYLGRLPITNTQ